MYGQVSTGQEQEFDYGIKNNSTQTVTTPTYLGTVGADGTYGKMNRNNVIEYLEFASAVNLPVTGEQGKLYLTKDNNKIYRWNGTFYQELASSDPTYQSVIDALTFTPENVANKSSTLTASSTLYPNNDAVIAGLALKEDKVNKVTSISLSANDTNYPSELAVKTYADNLVVGMLNDRGTWDASVNAFPTTGGSGVGGVIRKGDMWYVSVAGTLGTKSVNVGDSFRALVNAPAQVAANWSILEANIGYVPANDANVVHLTGAETITGVKTFNDIRAVTNYKSSTSNVIISDTDGLVFRGTRSGAWSDSVNSRFFQVGNSNDNVVFTTRLGAAANRMLFSSLKTQISSGSFVSGIIPLGIFEVTNGTNRFFNVFESGNSVFGGSPDDNINRLQVTGTVSSGTTALGNTPPIANNQLTRKDYVDTGLALKANSASPALTGTPTAPTATAGTNTTQVATTAFVQAGLATKEPSFTKNTAFNKNFGTTAGTVAEGNDSRLSDSRTPTAGSNNYIQNQNASAQAANMWVSGAGQFGSSVMASGGFKANGLSGEITSVGSGAGVEVFYYAGEGYVQAYDRVAEAMKPLRISGSHINFIGAATFSSTVTAAPATASNHVVVKSQLDAFVPSGTVNLTGDQTISGQKSFSLTGKIDMQTNNAFPAISVTSLGSNGQSAAEFINNSSSPNSTALALQTSSSGGVGNRALDVLNMSPIGTGIFSNASNGGVSISSQSGNGDSYISNITYGGTGRNYVGRNNGIETYSVDKIGKVTATSYTATSLPVFENNVAASSLAVGQFYRTSTGILMVKF